MIDLPTADLVGDCPDPETLAAYVDGLLGLPARAEVEAHAAECRDCREILADTAAFLLDVDAEEVPVPALTRVQPTPNVLPFPSRWRGGVVTALAVAAAALIVVRVEPTWLPWPGRGPDMAALVLALDHQPRRPIDGRLSAGVAYRQQPEVTRGAPGPEVAPDLHIAATELEIAASGQSAAQQAARGIAALAIGDADGGIRELETAVRQSPRNAAYLNDLAAAYLARAARTASATDQQQALRAADQSLAVTPSMPEALFNRALALQGLDRADEARAAWQAYLKVDPDSGWANEAKTRCTAC